MSDSSVRFKRQDNQSRNLKSTDHETGLSYATSMEANLVEIRIPKKFLVSFYILETDQKFLRNSNLNEIMTEA
jgi:hypothetical protein